MKGENKTKEQLINEATGMRKRITELEELETERKKAEGALQMGQEEALQESEERFKSLFLTMSEGVCLHEVIYDKSGKAIDYIITEVNPAYESTLNMDKERTVGSRASELYGLDEPPYLDIYAKVADTGVPNYFETYFPPMDKYFSISVFSPSQGRFATVFTDITERKQAEEELKEREKDYRKLFEAFPYGIAIHIDQKVVFGNTAVSEILRARNSSELMGRSIFDFVLPGSIKTAKRRQEVLKKGEVPHPELIKLAAFDGSVTNSELTAIHVTYQGKSAVMVVIRDVTDRMKAEEERNKFSDELRVLNVELEGKVKERTNELELATKEAGLANQSKSDFLANMSHELRTPLNAVIGFSQVLQEQYFGKLNEKQAEYITDILESGQHLLSLINDILDLSKIEAGKMELELSDVKIKELIEGSLVMIKEKALVHSISLNISCSKEMDDLRLMADERKLKQVMFNLLSNASKFTPDGGSINIKGWKEGELLNISVEDTGIGLSPEAQEKIFGEFYQVHSSMTDKTPGTGLGLPLTRSIIEMHDGRIWVESEGEGKGSRFTFTLPIG